MTPFMRFKRFAQLCCAALIGIGPIDAYAQNRCSIELILALDVSGSVDWKEYRLQRVGIASAFRDPELIELVSYLPGGIQIALTQWSGEFDQRVVLNWQSVKDKRTAFDFAEKVDDITRYENSGMTAIGNALIHANKLLRRNPKPCYKRVIDISSDGFSNRGNDPKSVSTILEAKDITINALVILDEDLSLLTYFEKNVVKGHGSFVQAAYGYDDYARAIKEKLLRELSPSLSHYEFIIKNNRKIARSDY